MLAQLNFRQRNAKTPRAAINPRMTAAPIISSSWCFSLARRCCFSASCCSRSRFARSLIIDCHVPCPNRRSIRVAICCLCSAASLASMVSRATEPTVNGLLDLFCLFFCICCSPVKSLSMSSAISEMSLAVPMADLMPSTAD